MQGNNNMNNMPWPMMQYQGFNPDMNVNQKKLENMYPKMYHIIYPHTCKYCDMIEAKYGSEYIPSKEHMDEIVDKIYENTNKEVEDLLSDNENERQFGSYNKKLLKSFITVLLINKLLKNKKNYGPGFGPGYGPGFGPGHGFGPGPGYGLGPGPGFGPGYGPGFGPGYGYGPDFGQSPY